MEKGNPINNPVTLYQQRLNLQGATFSRIDHEEALVATVYKVTQPNGEPLILKIHARPSDALREVYFLRHLADKVPVPHIRRVVEPQEGIDGAILMECLPGTLLQTSALTEPLAHELGRALALIHLNRLAGYGDPIQAELGHDPRPHFTLKFEEGLQECKDHLPSTTIEQYQQYFKSNLDLLASVDGPCIVHRDFRPGNLMVYKGELQGVIDWAGARASFAEEDFCSIEHGEWLTDPDSKKALLAGYATVRAIPDYDRLMPLLRLNKAIATIGFTVKRGIWESSGSPIYQFNRQFLETFLQDLK